MRQARKEGILSKDYYQILGVSRNASESDIKKAYRKLAVKHHPDRNANDPKAKERFQEINTAHDVLKDPQKRAAYDRVGHDAFQGSGGFHAGPDFSEFGQGDFSSVFDDLFSHFAGGTTRQGGGGQPRDARVHGEDMYYQMDLTLEEAFAGKSASIRFATMVECKPCAGTGSKSKTKPSVCQQCGGRGQVNVQRGIFMMAAECPSCKGAGVSIADPCTSCRGKGCVRGQKELKVMIPAGIEDQAQVRLSGKGGAGARGGRAGDLYIQVRIKPHVLFQRKGADLYCEYPLSFALAALGGSIEVPTIDGKEEQVNIPAGTQYGDQIAVFGKGMSQLNRSQRGNLYVQARVYTPVNLNSDQKDLIKRMHESEKNHAPKAKGFFSTLKKFFKKNT